MPWQTMPIVQCATMVLTNVLLYQVKVALEKQVCSSAAHFDGFYAAILNISIVKHCLFLPI